MIDIILCFCVFDTMKALDKRAFNLYGDYSSYYIQMTEQI